MCPSDGPSTLNEYFNGFSHSLWKNVQIVTWEQIPGFPPLTDSLSVHQVNNSYCVVGCGTG